MKKSVCGMMFVALFLAAPRVGLADDSKEAKKIIKKVDTATKALKGVAYEAETLATGPKADQSGKIVGKVKAKRGKGGLVGNLFGNAGNPTHFEGEAFRPGSEEPLAFEASTDGQSAYKLDTANKEFLYGEMPEAEPLLRPGNALFMQEYVHATPFSDELNADSAKIEGEEDVGGVKCHVIYVIYSGGQGEARWYFGQEDNLPHRVDRISRRRGSDQEKAYDCLLVKNLQIDPEFKKSDFRIKVPDGFKEKEFDGGAPEEEKPNLLAVGTKAPDWELATPDASTVSLKSLRGQVVVIDFWATWCGPCKMAMPGLQRLHEKFKDKPVKVIGLNCSEKKASKVTAMEVMQKKNCTYGLLLKADDVAEKYNVTNIPTFYVISPEGKIVYASEYGLDKEKELEEAIEKALKSDL